MSDRRICEISPDQQLHDDRKDHRHDRAGKNKSSDEALAALVHQSSVSDTAYGSQHSEENDRSCRCLQQSEEYSLHRFEE